ncbi:endo alpha-1,4 polygalactosaminidase [Microbacterium marinilacus]|uniref:Endo alpha-1,4 polygalactosaminidase n=1 Tax=Microbacterium marinilacus TaxID=415209 RepID=A0ABP7B6B7_9MICO|nr:endo alpha-1,4 polygalactosaminidase [Microbacterium marinilacus]MBY0687518.1 endo alpha-1,4 polygalactosaminidase [Microbacterium marinilacus]
MPAFIPTRAAGALVVAGTALALSACGAVAPAGLPAEGGVDYQLGGASTPPDGVTVVVRDVTAQPAAGVYSVCYVNGFQTQPGELPEWRADAPAAILEVDGGPVADPEWPDEYALDTRTDEARAAILARRGAEIEECARKGFDAVELDNLDAHTRFAALSEEGGLALAASYIDLAHDSGLAVAQKNSAELAERGPDLGFDFAVVEECLATEECDVYAAAYGTQVIDVEYELSDDEFDTRCAEAPNPRLTILRDLDLLPEGDPDRLYRACEG